MKKLLNINRGELAYMFCCEMNAIDNVIPQLCRTYSSADKNIYIYNPFIEGRFTDARIKEICHDYMHLDLIVLLDAIHISEKEASRFKDLKQSAISNNIGLLTFGSPPEPSKNSPLEKIIKSTEAYIKDYIDIFVTFLDEFNTEIIKVKG